MPTQEFFTPLSFDFLWESAGLGELPYPLQVRSHGANEQERIALRHRVDVELKARGIRDEHGRLDHGVEEWLRLLARPTVSVDALHIPDQERPPIAAIAGSDGKGGVLAIQDADGVWIRPIYPDGVVSAIVELLPPAGRGTEASITLPLEDAVRIAPLRTPMTSSAAPGTRGRRSKTGLADRPSEPREAYAQLAGQPRLRGGQLAANSRNSLGGKQRSPVLAWFDTASGRYLSLTRPGTDRREWVTVSPADPKTLRSRLGEMLTQVSDTR